MTVRSAIDRARTAQEQHDRRIDVQLRIEGSAVTDFTEQDGLDVLRADEDKMLALGNEEVEAARVVLHTHDALLGVRSARPQRDPLNPSEWDRWYLCWFKPANYDWMNAMDDLDDVMGVSVSRDPDIFRPYCAWLIIGGSS